MAEFLKETEFPERRAFIETSVGEILVMPGKAVVRYTVPMAGDNPRPGRGSEEILLSGLVTSAADLSSREPMLCSIP